MLTSMWIPDWLEPEGWWLRFPTSPYCLTNNRSERSPLTDHTPYDPHLNAALKPCLKAARASSLTCLPILFSPGIKHCFPSPRGSRPALLCIQASCWRLVWSQNNVSLVLWPWMNPITSLAHLRPSSMRKQKNIWANSHISTADSFTRWETV